MTVDAWVASFEYPDDCWYALDMTAEDAAERVAQAVADRGGPRDQEYAEAVYPELTAIRESAAAREASPVVVFVPPEPLPTRPLVPVTVFCAPVASPADGVGVEGLAELARQPRPYRYRDPLVSLVELPAGPACRVHELVLDDPGEDGRRGLVEYVSYYVAPPGYPRGLIELTVTWPSPTLGAALVETADEIALTLALRSTSDDPRASALAL
ncbi:hypothetical protein RM844_24960 [Streptomyces sp. DSM 44915]|uniref:Uncharacterized protein n=1 Tax=Streptomyces chisholmiae TaxID=3075540 RepID=A0ABU2JX57_9ACTN|nr:hypothetical protein [Streptomyces sp. DSM 44915]MDT0269537.1 hypothetical protein [Streptomyces sp. DSM 44915]